jgi:hypothetical protein
MARPEKTLSIPESSRRREPLEPQAPAQRRAMPEVQQFRLLVDRQAKASFATFEAAEKAALAIKKAYPVVQVTVYDAKEGVAKMIGAPATAAAS